MRHIAIFQSKLPTYRIPLYRTLNALPGWRVTAVHGPILGRGSEGPFELSYQLVNTSAGPLVWQRKVIDALEEIQPNAVVVHGNPWILSNRKILRWCADQNIPSYLWGLGFAPGRRSGIRRLAHPLGRRLLRMLLSQTSAGVLAYSQYAANVYRELMPRPLPVNVIGNATFAIQKSAQQSPAPAGRRLLFVGRLEPYKRVDVLIEALSLSLADPALELDIVGTGSEEVALRQMAEDYNVQRIRFHGHQPPETVKRMMSNAHFLVLPGRGGLAVQEALACGLPVIALPGIYGGGDGTVDDLLDSSIAGEMIQGRSPEALCAALDAGFTNADWVDRRRAAFDVASRDGGLDEMVARFQHTVEASLA